MRNTRDIPLEHGGYYHIYNRGNNGEQLFYTSENYYHFLRLYEKYIDPIANTYAWCLMGNHFHFLVRIKEEDEIGYLPDLNAFGSVDAERFKWCTIPNPLQNPPVSAGSGGVGESDCLSISAPSGGVWRKRPIPHRMFGHLFNAYARYLNNKNGRTGSLFEKNFHRIPINSDKYFQNLIIYIHQNPVHHGFADDFRDYPWSSYGSVVAEKPTRIKRKEVLDWFDGRENFIKSHFNLLDSDLIDHLTVD